MADRTVQVITPATDTDLMTLDEAKTLLGISPSDTSGDTQLAFFISVNSATVARLCNRVFAYEEVCETWRELGATSYWNPGFYYPYYPGYFCPCSNSNRGHRIISLSHWPIVPEDIQSVESPPGTVIDPSCYELEGDSGKLSSLTGPWFEPVVVTYSGGYQLPDDAPLPLKQACSLLNVQSKLLASLSGIAGIRMLAHKEVRTMFHDPLKIIEAAMGGVGSPTHMAVMNLLSHYIRIEV